MKAVRIETHGGPEVLRLVELPTPKPGPGQVLVGIEAVGVNFIDTYQRSGLYQLPLPAVLTQDDEPAVVCVEAGKAVRTPVRLGSRQGDRVEVLLKQTRPARRGEPAAWGRFTGAEEVVVSDPHALADGQAVRGRPAGVERTRVARAGRGE